MKTEAVLFDLDGTLVDSLQLIIKTYRLVFAEMNIPWGDDEVVKMIGLPLKDIGRHFAGSQGPFFEELYQRHYLREHDLHTRLFPGTLKILEKLKACGIKLGVVTSKGRAGTDRALNLTGIGSFMDVVVTAHDVSRHKPDPEPLLIALKRLGTAAARSIYVGDSKFDVLAGQRAGTRTLAVTWGLGTREELAQLKPDGLIDRWEELAKYI
ncbi:MAG: HAD-IA family hydrolase [Pelotomaculum sp.]|nr:HAD-IA family hydrolase [Pelotomaculum sp.]